MKSISHTTVVRAYAHVFKELSAVGLMTQALCEVPVVVQAFDIGPFVLAYEGLYVEEPGLGGLLGFSARTIYVPRLSLSRLIASVRGGVASSMRDILRHELGHAFAVEHPGLVRRSTAFTRAFGARYDDHVAQDEEDCVSAYAASSPAEDFAETFMTYVRVGGDITRFKKGGPAVHRKLRFVAALANEVRRRRLGLANG